MKKIVLAAAGITGICLMTSVNSADGTIEFSGSLVDHTCIINGNDADLQITLPTISIANLQDLDSTGGRTPFAINLTACSPAIQKVSAYFEPGASLNPDTGRLTLDPGGAKNIEIGLQNDAFGTINVGAPIGSQNSQLVNITGGTANLKYYAQYESLGGATSGAVSSRVRYTLVYE